MDAFGLGGLLVSGQHLDARGHFPAVATGPVQVPEDNGPADLVGAVQALAKDELHNGLLLAFLLLTLLALAGPLGLFSSSGIGFPLLMLGLIKRIFLVGTNWLG